MGSSPSKEETVQEVPADMQKLDEQLEQLKLEVTNVQPSIIENVKQTINQEQDALLMRYSQLTDRTKIAQDIKKVFGNFPLLEFITETAITMVSVLTTSSELTEILRWQQRKMVKRVGNKVYGVEVHYKVKILEESKGSIPFRSTKDTVALLAYKCIAHSMDLDPADVPDDEEYKQIKF